MSGRSREAAFSELVRADRGLLLGAAYLMHGDRGRAEEIVQAVLAELYRSPAAADPRAAALRGVLQAKPGLVALPWQRGGRFELLDDTARRVLPQGIVADLAEVDESARRVVILQHLAALDPSRIAAVLGLEVTAVHGLARQATSQLSAHEPARVSAEHLTQELRAAAYGTVRAEPNPAADLAHGRYLVRRDRLRVVVVAVALVLVAVLGGTQVIPLLRPPAQAAGTPLPVTTTARPAPACDTSRPACRAQLVREWRNEMTKVANSYLDPEGSYFSGYTYSDDDLYESDGLWSGAGGVLGLDLSRLNRGGTEIYLQIATSRQYAVPCGQRTDRTCMVMRFMDGNVFTFTDTDRAAGGIEVQYSPYGNEVITVVARNMMGGTALEVDRSDLMALVQDKRLHLPRT